MHAQAEIKASTLRNRDWYCIIRVCVLKHALPWQLSVF